MKLESKYFDSIRVKGTRSGRRSDSQADVQQCQWRDCAKRGSHRAPKGRDAEGEYYNFCQEHVAAYNKSYNYFTGMDDGAVADYQKSAATGHRPTWSLGVNSATAPMRDPIGSAVHDDADPLEVLKTVRARIGAKQRPKPEVKRRVVQKGARKHLLSLNLDDQASPQEIRTQFKALVKLHHPDHNGGDRGSEERFREVIAAYNFLKQSGLC